MNKEKIKLDSFILAGISARTNNQNEMNPQNAKIGAMMNSYWTQQIANEFEQRINPGVTYSVYTNYESDEHGDYTYFLGEKVQSVENQIGSKINSLLIPASYYQKFTVVGKLPDVVIAAWQQIWQMTSLDFGGKRTYKADFEIYDQRVVDPNHATVDIYIGIESN